MPRRREVPERTIIPDSKYESKLVAKFITSIMRDGKKSTAESIVYNAFDIIEDKTKDSPLKIKDLFIAIWRPAVASLLTGGILAAFNFYVFSQFHLILRLLLSSIVFTISYFILVFILPGGRTFLFSLVRLSKEIIPKKMYSRYSNSSNNLP